MLQTNPFKAFSPARSKYLILGSFAAKDAKSGFIYDWYYSNGRNQFWPILEEIYGKKLRNKKTQHDLFRKLSIAIADIIYQCRRQTNSSLDVHLTDIVYNTLPISKVLQNNPIEKIFFTSRFVEKEYKRNFKELVNKYPSIELITLPSPSPRYASMSKQEKIKKYKEIFPGL